MLKTDKQHHNYKILESIINNNKTYNFTRLNKKIIIYKYDDDHIVVVCKQGDHEHMTLQRISKFRQTTMLYVRTIILDYFNID